MILDERELDEEGARACASRTFRDPVLFIQVVL
jgi:hypothetical protein